jgi:hypothetical protein
MVTLPNINRVSEILPTAVTATPYLPFPGFAQNMSYTTTDGNSFFYSMQAKYEHRFNGGFSMLAAYTWGQVKDDISDVLFSTLSYRAPYLPGFGIHGDYGLANFNVHNAIHISGGYELPFGYGKHFLNGKGWKNAIAGGWRLNGLSTFQSGTPLTVGCTISTTDGMGCNALLVPGQSLYAGARTVSHWVNAAAFTNPPVATAIGQTSYAPLGGAPTQVVGPAFHRGDATLAKSWRTSEKTRLEFRTDVFNVTNTPNFGQPGSLNFGTAKTFASITTTRDSPDDPRELQLSLKLYF